MFFIYNLLYGFARTLRLINLMQFCINPLVFECCVKLGRYRSHQRKRRGFFRRQWGLSIYAVCRVVNPLAIIWQCTILVFTPLRQNVTVYGLGIWLADLGRLSLLKPK